MATPTASGWAMSTGPSSTSCASSPCWPIYFLEVRGERGPIVKTVSTTSMLNKLGERYGVPVYETGVGFKYISPKMLEVDALIGGEESGGYAFRDHVPERDGLLAGLFLLDMMVRLGKKPSELVQLLFREGRAHYYDRIDTAPPGRRRRAQRGAASARTTRPSQDRWIEGDQPSTRPTASSSCWRMAAGFSSASPARNRWCGSIVKRPSA